MRRSAALGASWRINVGGRRTFEGHHFFNLPTFYCPYLGLGSFGGLWRLPFMLGGCGWYVGGDLYII